MVTVFVTGLMAGLGLWLALTASVPSAPSLGRAVARLHRPPPPPSMADAETAAVAGSVTFVGRRVLRWVKRLESDPRLIADLAVIGRPLELHAGYLAAAAVGGFLGSTVLAGVAQTAGAAVPWLVPLPVAVGVAVLAVVLVWMEARQRADEIRRDLRNQLGAFLDVLTMLLAANEGTEGALKRAAEAGDGRLFIELRRAFSEASKANRPLVTGLDQLGALWDVNELREIASSAGLATSKGAPVRTTLTARADSLRSQLLAAEEEQARVQSNKISFPLVAMGVLFMAMGIYPVLVSGAS